VTIHVGVLPSEAAFVSTEGNESCINYKEQRLEILQWNLCIVNTLRRFLAKLPKQKYFKMYLIRY
jgi:hypothetical protein